MPDAYTYIAKPIDDTYSAVNAQGREQYDQATISYDDPNVFYDGVDINAYVYVAKPTGNGSVEITPGMATGLLIPLTYSTSYIFDNDDWTKVIKPTT